MTTAIGSHEVFLEDDESIYERPGAPSNVLPSRPSTSLPRLATPQSSKPFQASTNIFFEQALVSSTATHSRPYNSFSGLGPAIEKFRSHPTRALSRRKRSNFALVHPSGAQNGGHLHKYSESCPVHAIHRESFVNSPTSGWLRRCLITTSGQGRPPSSPVSSHTQFHFMTVPSYSYEDENFTALPSFPGTENETLKSPEKIPSGTAARAAAAAQNEILESLRNIRLAEPKVTRDSESGVGIEVRGREESAIDFDIPVIRKGEVKNSPF